jgi:small conductance mechanosensitive channel
MEAWMQKIQEVSALYGLKLLAALAILIIGRWVAKVVTGLIRRVLTKRKLDPTIVTFGANLVYITLMTFVIIAALAQVGIQTTSFIAVIGAAGLAIGLALQGSLANFAAGFLIILFRPFKAGDFIEAAGVMGIVEEIQVFTTKLKTPDNKEIIVPNSKITGDNITNFTAKETRRCELTFGVSYTDDIDKVRALIKKVIDADTRVLKDPAPQIVVGELADSSVNFIVRVWVKVPDYWGVYFDAIENVKKTFDAEGVSIPFPQRDLHVFQHQAAA